MKLRCSECSTVLEKVLAAEEKELVCPACGRRLQNLTAEEHQEIETLQKNQRLYSIISLVLFILAVVCLVLWMVKTGDWPSNKDRQEASIGFFAGFAVLGIASMVLAFLGSRKRIIVEF
ncbi:MAG: hypothetical protein NTW87_33905 [Planctomycetota bacterium]|nr:hypothetical protein [Planctomycetota bacterium]